jgi:ferric-dicitrate binding protein FerR (iron transport regulator)
MMSNYESDNGPSLDEATDMNNQFERFELLSAYMDGEVTAAERQQVQQWLDTDPQFHQLYTQLLRLQREIPTVPVPTSSPETQPLSDRVFESIDRQHRVRRLTLVGGFAVAALVVGLLSNFWWRDNSLIPYHAQNPTLPTDVEVDPLTIALNRPMVEIPPDAQ